MSAGVRYEDDDDCDDDYGFGLSGPNESISGPAELRQQPPAQLLQPL